MMENTKLIAFSLDKIEKLSSNLDNISSRISVDNIHLMVDIEKNFKAGTFDEVKSLLLDLADLEDTSDYQETALSDFIRSVAEEII